MRKKRKFKEPKKVSFSVDPTHFFNRDLSWLQFNRRVLSIGLDENTPLIERLRFLLIFSSNLDEFVMKRIGYIKHQHLSSHSFKSVDGKTPGDILKLIRQFLLEDLALQRKALKEIFKKLEDQNIEIVKIDDLKKNERDYCQEYFEKKIYPILTPLSVDPGHPFPFISNLAYSLGIILKNPKTKISLFSRVKIPNLLPGLLNLPENDKKNKNRFITISSLVQANLPMLYPGMEILEVVPFRVTRNADVDHSDDETEDLLHLVEEGLKERRLSECVRLEVSEKCSDSLREFLREALEITVDDVYMLQDPLDLGTLKSILDLDLPQHKYPKWVPVVPKVMRQENFNLFNYLKQNDLLVHHPYESFSASVERFILSAADDPNVLTIKMTLYRTGDNSPFIKALIKAAESGKQVVCLIELKARFDEQRNILWAHKLEDAGVHVVYGIMGLKTHTKTALVIRTEDDGSMMAYTHIGTGNYHSQTSNLYTDFGLFTSDKKICTEVIEVFNYLTGSSLKADYKHLLVAPLNMKENFIELIKNEIENKKKGKPALVIAKMNSLEDETISEKLYEASREGVKIILIVRGFCCLKPGVKDLSENISVISLIGRFLEHSRVFYFADGSDDPSLGKFYIGSADWMHRNLHNRVELITPIKDKKLKLNLWDFLQININDQRLTWDLQIDGSYKQRKAKDQNVPENAHDLLMKRVIKEN